MIRATICILKKLAAYIEILGFGENSKMLPHKLKGRNTQENARNENLITLYNIFDHTLLKKIGENCPKLQNNETASWKISSQLLVSVI